MEEQNLKQTQTKVCKHCQSEIPKGAKVCPNCRKKQGGKIKFIIIAIIAIIVVVSIVKGGDSDSPSDSNPKKVAQSDSADTEKNNEDNQEEKDEEKVFVVGDVVETSDLKITFVSAGKYKSDNEFIQPKEGNVYYKMEFEFENISDSDKALSTALDWTCYADSYKVDQMYIGEDNGLDATFSPGKKAKGSVIFELPKDSKEVTLEYSPSFWSENKVVFKAK